MFGKLINILKENPKKIVFTEGSDPRILEAASRLLASTFLSPILVGNKDEIAKAAEESAFNIRGAEIIDPMEYEGIDEMAVARLRSFDSFIRFYGCKFKKCSLLQ